MRITQGTTVFVTTMVLHPFTKQPFDPDDVLVNIWTPAATSPTTISYSGGDVTRLAVGTYRFGVDTTAAGGSWRYEVTATGPMSVSRQGLVYAQSNLA